MRDCRAAMVVRNHCQEKAQAVCVAKGLAGPNILVNMEALSLP